MSKSLRNNEKGLGHIVVIVLAVVVVAAIAVAAWRIADSYKKNNSTNYTATSNGTSNNSTSTAEYNTCMSTYHDSRLCHFASNSVNFSKMAYTATLKGALSSASGTMTLKNDGKGNTELISSGGGQTINVITLDNVEYVQNNGTGPWIEYPSGANAPSTNPTSNMNIGVGNAGLTFKYLGTESCGSLTCYKYQVTDKSMPGTTQYVWFDNSSYEMRQWQATDSNGNTTDMTITYGPVTISKPSPVQNLSQTTP